MRPGPPPDCGICHRTRIVAANAGLPHACLRTAHSRRPGTNGHGVMRHLWPWSANSRIHGFPVESQLGLPTHAFPNETQVLTLCCLRVELSGQFRSSPHCRRVSRSQGRRSLSAGFVQGPGTSTPGPLPPDSELPRYLARLFGVISRSLHRESRTPSAVRRASVEFMSAWCRDNVGIMSNF